MGTPVAVTHKPAVNVAAVATFADPGGSEVQILDNISWSYNAAPTGGNIKVESPAGVKIYEEDVPAAGGFSRSFGQAGLPGAVGEAVIVTLAAAGAAVQGIVNAVRR